jgi:hypothetical protein
LDKDILKIGLSLILLLAVAVVSWVFMTVGIKFLDQQVQLLIVGGIILIIVVVAVGLILRGQTIILLSHHKIQAIALMGLISIGLVAVIGSLAIKGDLSSLIGVAGAAVGGIAGFLTHKMIPTDEQDNLPQIDEKKGA